MRVPFNRPAVTSSELSFIKQAIESGSLAGGGAFTKRCQAWLEAELGTRRALLTTSATMALEMQALLLDLKPGDEVIMPSFTFVTTATSFLLRGVTPVFVDVRHDTLNLDETQVEAAITPRSRAIVAVHYAGVGCEMDRLMEIACHHGLVLLEDAAQGLSSTYRSRPLGSIGSLGALSFHETKNLHCGEGGALLINEPSMAERAQILWEKGTNRSRFLRGEVDKYTWVDIGSSFQPSELNSAFLLAQLEQIDVIQTERMAIWRAFHEAFEPYETAGQLRRPFVPAHCDHNAHMYYLVFPDLAQRSSFIAGLAKRSVNAVFHYVPLHSSPAGQRFCRVASPMPVTDEAGEGLVRLPLWPGMGDELEYVIESALAVLDEMFVH